MRSKPYIEVCHCPACDEPDPHCEHGINLATTACATCDAVIAERVMEMRQALVAYYDDKAGMHQASAEEFGLMSRTVKYLDDDGVMLEYTNKIGAQQ